MCYILGYMDEVLYIKGNTLSGGEDHNKIHFRKNGDASKINNMKFKVITDMLYIKSSKVSL